jgi:hypothetical protein
MSLPRRHYRCRFCGLKLRAWLPVAKLVEGSMLLYHLAHAPGGAVAVPGAHGGRRGHRHRGGRGV